MFIVKLFAEVELIPPTVTVNGPVVAPEGAVVIIWVGVQLVTTAVIPLKVTVLLDGLVLKFSPVIVTDVPGSPFAGVKPEIVGELAEIVGELAVEVLLLPQPARRKT